MRLTGGDVCRKSLQGTVTDDVWSSFTLGGLAGRAVEALHSSKIEFQPLVLDWIRLRTPL
jgi:hypothetical protein